MNVLYVCGDQGIRFSGSAGASVHVRQTVGALRAANIPVDVLMLGDGDRPSALKESAGIERREAAWAEQCASVARSWASTVLLEANRVDVVYERYSLWSRAGSILADRFEAPLLLEVNSPLIEEQRRFRQLGSEALAQEIEHEVLTRADAVLCVSSPLCERVARLRNTKRGIWHWPNSVDTSLFQPLRIARAARQSAVTLCFVGSFKPWHGCRNLLAAFERVAAARSDARFVMIGDGPERGELERRTLEAGLAERVRFTGAVAQEQVAAELAAADVGVLANAPDQGDYFSPLKLGEYLSSGLAVVATFVGDRVPPLVPGRDLLLVDYRKPEALSEALVRLIDDPPLRLALGEAGRAAAYEHFSLADATKRLVSLMNSLRARE